MIESFGAAAGDFVGPQSQLIVAISLAAPWDKALNGLIPERLVAVKAIWNKVNIMDVGDWNQGAKAMANLLSSQRVCWRNFFEKVAELNESDHAMRAAAEVNDAVAALPAGIIFQ